MDKLMTNILVKIMYLDINLYTNTSKQAGILFDYEHPLLKLHDQLVTDTDHFTLEWMDHFND